MTSGFAEQIRRHAPGTLQNRLVKLSGELAPEDGGQLMDSARLIGDHAAGLATALSTVGLISLDKALPKFGKSSELVRKGKTLVFSAETGEIDKVPVMIDPSKARLLK